MDSGAINRPLPTVWSAFAFGSSTLDMSSTFTSRVAIVTGKAVLFAQRCQARVTALDEPPLVSLLAKVPR